MVRHIAIALFFLLCGGGCAALRGTATDPVPFGVDLCSLHPVEDPGPEVARRCAAVALSVRDHVHVYFVNGFDPLHIGNVKGLCSYVKAAGFSHGYCGEMTHTPLFHRVIRKVRTEDPSSRIVLVGYSAGANAVRDLTHDLKQDGITVDLLVYVGGDTIRNTPYNRPSNVGCLLNITAHGLALLGGDMFFKGCDLDGAVNERLDSGHMALPSRSQTAELLVRYLIATCEGPPVTVPR